MAGEEKRILEMDRHEHGVVLNALNEYRNDVIAEGRTTDLIDGYIDFDKALEDPEKPNWFRKEYDSGDHLHPSKSGYERMAWEVPEELLK